MFHAGIACALVAFCLSRWQQEADSLNFVAKTTGNGFYQALFGRGVLRLAPPACYRILFPFVVAPDRTEAPYEIPEASWSRWWVYQTLRYLVVWLALLFLTSVLGIVGMLIAAALFGLTLHFDYWSNGIELLSVGLVLASGVFHWPWYVVLALGALCGTGRETLPFLAVLGTLPAIVFATGALASQVAVRAFVRTEEHWYGTLEYANPMWRTNWGSVTGRHGGDAQVRVLVWVGLAALAFPAAPWLTLALAGTTALIARMDEPRVLTMLIPFAAMTLCR